MSEAAERCAVCAARVFVPWVSLVAGFPARCAEHPFIVLVTGSRKHRDATLIWNAFNQLLPNTIVVHGDADGADTLADQAATSRGFRTRKYPVDWPAARRTFGARYRHCGPWRNRWMYYTEVPDLVLAFPLPGSRGTLDMLSVARAGGTPCQIIESP
jgi:hypothetical protein